MSKPTTMQRRHFELIASVIADLRANSYQIGDPVIDVVSVDDITREFSRALRATNSNFDAARFEYACGMQCDVEALSLELRQQRHAPRWLAGDDEQGGVGSHGEVHGTRQVE